MRSARALDPKSLYSRQESHVVVKKANSRRLCTWMDGIKHSSFGKRASQRLGGKEFTCNSGDIGNAGLIPSSGKSPGGGNGSPLQYSCLGNAVDRGAWRAVVRGVAKESNMT